MAELTLPLVMQHSIDADGYRIIAQPAPFLRGFTKEIGIIHEKDDAELIVTAVNAHADLQAALKRAADMLHAVAGDLEDGYSLDTLRGKYVMAVLGARDAAYAALKLARGET